MASHRRWVSAQQYEQAFWARQAEQIANGITPKLDFYGYKARVMQDHLADCLRLEQHPGLRILEIGSGPVGIVSALPWGERYTIDPLEQFYSVNPALTHFRDPRVRRFAGTGEQLPFDAEYFSLVIIDNVLDHVQSPIIVLKECRRVLDNQGLLYLAMNLRTRWGALLHSVLSRLRIDQGHPHSFTQGTITRVLADCHFGICKELVTSYADARSHDRHSGALKDRLKGISGISEFLYYGVCAKESNIGLRDSREPVRLAIGAKVAR